MKATPALATAAVLVVAIALLFVFLGRQEYSPESESEPVGDEIRLEAAQRLDAADLKERIDRGERLLLIDVREDHEIEEHGAIPGAVHIPMGELERRMQDIPRDIALVFY